jgi:uncharacterized protein DUF1837
MITLSAVSTAHSTYRYPIHATRRSLSVTDPRLRYHGSGRLLAVMEGLVLAEEYWIGEHHFAIYDVEPEVMVDLLAETVRKLYVETATLQQTLEVALMGLEDIADVPAVEEVVRAVAAATVPVPGVQTSMPWLDLARNEVAEVLACVAAEALYEAPVLAPRVRNKEVTGQPSRGIDLIGFGETPVHLLCGEVKASAARSSPPDVVSVGTDSLRAQLLGHIGDRKRILRELNWVHKHVEPNYHPIVARFILRWICKELPVRIFPLLLRPSSCCTVSDFGAFIESPEEYAPAQIRFCIARIPCTIEDFAGRVYTRARE